MKKPIVIIIVISTLLTAAAFWHDYKYDIPSQPYTTTQYLVEIPITGTIYISLFSVILFAIYKAIRSVIDQ